MEAVFVAPDIECGGCAASIQKALGQERGVHSVAVDVPTRAVTVGFDGALTGPAQIAATLADIGFPTKDES